MSIRITALLLVAFSAVAYSKSWPTCMCTLEYAPVCGSDGNTYSNACHLHCSNGDGKLHVAYPGPCSGSGQASSSCERPCPLYFIEGKFCGTDGTGHIRDFGNECVLEVELCKATEEGRLLSRVECPQTTTARPATTTPPPAHHCNTFCPLYMIEGMYCGQDHTGAVHDFGNPCFLSSAQCIANNDGLTLLTVACPPK